MTNFQHLIEKALTKFPKAKRVAVENFSCSADKLDMATEMNLQADTQAYKWNSHTVNAIRWVINNKVEETMSGAIKCGNRSFILPNNNNTDVVPPEFPYGVEYTTGTC